MQNKKLTTTKKVALTGEALINKLKENNKINYDKVILLKEENRKLKRELDDLRNSVCNWREEQARFYKNWITSK